MFDVISSLIPSERRENSRLQRRINRSCEGAHSYDVFASKVFDVGAPEELYQEENIIVNNKSDD